MTSITESIRSVKFGVLLALFTIVFGFGMGIAFGAFEDDIKDNLKASANTSKAYEGEKAKNKEKTIKKSWVYIKRAHFHAGGIGAAALALIILLGLTSTTALLKLIASIMVGLGSFGYPLGWLFAGLKAPALGSTHLGKEAIAWLALPSAMLLVGGTILVLLLFIYDSFLKSSEN